MRILSSLVTQGHLEPSLWLATNLLATPSWTCHRGVLKWPVGCKLKLCNVTVLASLLEPGS